MSHVILNALPVGLACFCSLHFPHTPLETFHGSAAEAERKRGCTQCAGATICKVFCARMYVSAYVCVCICLHICVRTFFLEGPEFNLPLAPLAHQALTLMLLGCPGSGRKESESERGKQARPQLCFRVPSQTEGQARRTEQYSPILPGRGLG